MDPNANLSEQRRLAAQFLAIMDDYDEATGEPTRAIREADVFRLAELVEALDEWIARGGFLPTAWQAGR